MIDEYLLDSKKRKMKIQHDQKSNRYNSILEGLWTEKWLNWGKINAIALEYQVLILSYKLMGIQILCGNYKWTKYQI